VACSRVTFTFTFTFMGGSWRYGEERNIFRFFVINNNQITFLQYTGWHRSPLTCILRLVSEFCAIFPPTDLHLDLFLAFDKKIKGKTNPITDLDRP